MQEASKARRRAQGERAMPVWTVQISGGENEQVEAWALATEAGALVALGEDGLLVQARRPGQGRTGPPRRPAGASPRRRARGATPVEGRGTSGGVLVGVPWWGRGGAPARHGTSGSGVESPAGTAA